MDALDPKNFWPFSWINEMVWKYRRWQTQRNIAKRREAKNSNQI